MDPTLRFGGGNPLYTVSAGFEFEPSVDAGAGDAGDHLLEATHVAGALRDELDLPAIALGEARVHPEQVAGEQRRFVAAGAGAYLEEDIALIVRILGQERTLQLLLQSLHGGGCSLRFVLGVSLHLRIAEELACGREVALRLLPVAV